VTEEDAVMALITDIRRSVTESTPVLAVVGATDLAVERVRAAAENASTTAIALQADLEKAVSGASAEVGRTVSAYQAALEPAAVQARVQKALDPKTLQATVQQVPALAVSRVLEVAGQVETRYTGLADRGRDLVDRVRTQKATQDLIAQGKTTISRTRAAVTTARKAVDETTAAARSTVTVGRKEVKDAARGVEKQVEESVAASEKVVADRTSRTRAAARRTATTARKNAAGTRSAAKGAATSARKTAAQAEKAAENSARKVGD
jgi:hypothetical protein